MGNVIVSDVQAKGDTVTARTAIKESSDGVRFLNQEGVSTRATSNSDVVLVTRDCDHVILTTTIDQEFVGSISTDSDGVVTALTLNGRSTLECINFDGVSTVVGTTSCIPKDGRSRKSGIKGLDDNGVTAFAQIEFCSSSQSDSCSTHVVVTLTKTHSGQGSCL